MEDPITGLNYIIDAGGTDITVTMSVMNTMTGIEIKPVDLTNGLVTEYIITIDTFVFLGDRDLLLIKTPEEVGFGPDGLGCKAVSPAPVGVTECSAETNDNESFFVQLDEIARHAGIFEVAVSGLKNPPNFRRSGLFSNIKMQTYDYYNIMYLESHDHLWIQTDTPATVSTWKLEQSTVVLGLDASYALVFTPENPIGPTGHMTLKWSDQVEFYQ